MRIEWISTGEEVLSGQITDTNAVWLSQFLAEKGLSVDRRVTVGDRMEELAEVIEACARRADVVFVNGGLGPTDDDLSAAVAARLLGEDLVEFPEWTAKLKRKFAESGREMPPRNLKQSMLPASAVLLDNPRGTACGFAVCLHNAWVYFTPGPPGEMHKMVRDEIMPHLRGQRDVPAESFVVKLTSFGIAEARLNDLVAHVPLPPGLTMGFRAHFPYIEIKLMGAGDHIAQKAAEAAEVVRAALGQHLVYEDGIGLEGRIQELMIASGETLSLAESCTGGMIASRLVDVPGSSAYFERGFVTYSNEAKNEMIDVPMALIQKHGAVSLEVARAMAVGARKRSGTTYALSVSGVAGPDGGTEAKPVGTIAFALAGPKEVYAMVIGSRNWGRTKIRIASSIVALDMLRRKLIGISVFPQYDYIDIKRKEISET